VLARACSECETDVSVLAWPVLSWLAPSSAWLDTLSLSSFTSFHLASLLLDLQSSITAAAAAAAIVVAEYLKTWRCVACPFGNSASLEHFGLISFFFENQFQLCSGDLHATISSSYGMFPQNRQILSQ
jgi:hypothetical protein